MFGYPTGIGTLIVKKSLLAQLERPRFSEGTVDVVQVPGKIFTRSTVLHEQFEVRDVALQWAYANFLLCVESPYIGWNNQLCTITGCYERTSLCCNIFSIYPSSAFNFADVSGIFSFRALPRHFRPTSGADPVAGSHSKVPFCWRASGYGVHPGRDILRRASTLQSSTLRTIFLT